MLIGYFYFRMTRNVSKAAPTVTVSRAGALWAFVTQYSMVIGGFILLIKLANDFLPWYAIFHNYVKNNISMFSVSSCRVAWSCFKQYVTD